MKFDSISLLQNFRFFTVFSHCSFFTFFTYVNLHPIILHANPVHSKSIMNNFQCKTDDMVSFRLWIYCGTTLAAPLHLWGIKECSYYLFLMVHNVHLLWILKADLRGENLFGAHFHKKWDLFRYFTSSTPVFRWITLR